MNIKEALDELLEDLIRIGAGYEMAGHEESERLDAERESVKSAVLALYEQQGQELVRQKKLRLDAAKIAAEARTRLTIYRSWADDKLNKQKAIADELAGALNNMVAFHVCDNCLWPGHSCREKDCRGVAQVAAAALAAYEKTKEG